ncbi:Protein of unknown function [Gryllus bimaculatus]|nr:Protein of unknown function [Gryllus bimaculatus]
MNVPEYHLWMCRSHLAKDLSIKKGILQHGTLEICPLGVSTWENVALRVTHHPLIESEVGSKSELLLLVGLDGEIHHLKAIRAFHVFHVQS